MRNNNEIFYDALEKMNMKVLKEVTEFVQKPLCEMMDLHSWKILASSFQEELEYLEQEFPGTLNEIPFEAALIARNRFLIHRNSGRYFTEEGWQETLHRIMFLERDRLLYIAELEETKHIRKLINLLEGIAQEVQTIPEIWGLEKLCSGKEMQLYYKRHCLKQEKSFDKANTQRDEINEKLELFMNLRQITGNHDLRIGSYNDHYDPQVIKEIPFERYRNVVIDLEALDEPVAEEKLRFLIINCTADQLELENGDKKHIELLFHRFSADEDLQEKIFQIFAKHGQEKELCTYLEQDNHKYGAFGIIWRKMYEKEEQDGQI